MMSLQVLINRDFAKKIFFRHRDSSPLPSNLGLLASDLYFPDRLTVLSVHKSTL